MSDSPLGAPWIGVDLDGTLAHYDRYVAENPIGAPVPAMLARVKAWLAAGKRVKVFTARVGPRGADDGYRELKAIQDWCLEHIGQALEVTATKDYQMVELWDDRAVSVEKNGGRAIAWHLSSGVSHYDAEYCIRLADDQRQKIAGGRA